MKVIFIYLQGYDSVFPKEDSDYYWVSGHTGMLARQLSKRTDLITFESWRLDKTVKVNKEKRVRGVLCKIYPCKKYPIIGCFSFKMIKDIKKEFKDDKVIIHCSLPYNILYFFRIIFPFRKIVVSHFGTKPPLIKKSNTFKKNIKNLFRISIDNLFLKLFNHYFVASNIEIDILKKKGVKQDNISFPEIGTDTTLFYPRDKTLVREKLGLPINKKIILYIGHFVDGRGVKELIDIFPKLKQYYSDSKILMVGGRPENKYWEQVNKLDDFIVLGYTNYQLLPLYHNAADISIRIDFQDKGPFSVGTNVFESLCCNTPVVSTTLKHLPKNLQNNVGIHPKTQDDIFEGIKYIFVNPEKFVNCGDEIKKIYSWDSICSEMIRVYLKHFNNKKG